MSNLQSDSIRNQVTDKLRDNVVSDLLSNQASE
jgi:hypothetical protein